MTDETTVPAGEMPAETDLTGGTPAVQEPSDASSQVPEAEEFDKDRAMATIRKLREEAKAATRQLKELDVLRQERKTREDAELSEKDRLSKRASDLEAELAREREITQHRLTEYEVRLAASALNIVDPDAAVKLLDLEYGDDGKPIDIQGALKDLIEAKPYLLRQDAPQGRPAGSATNPATRTPSPGSRTYTAGEIADRAFYLTNKDDIVKALREGRIRDG